MMGKVIGKIYIPSSKELGVTSRKSGKTHMTRTGFFSVTAQDLGWLAKSTGERLRAHCDSFNRIKYGIRFRV